MSNDENDDEHELEKQEQSFKKTCNYKFKQELESEDVGVDFRGANGLHGSQSTQEDREQRLIEEQHERLGQKKNDPSGSGLTMQELRNDGFQNRDIRSLTVAAFLRCLYGAIEFAPTNEMRNQTIKSLQDPIMFRHITMLCDSTGWDDNANIGAKYLKIMRSVIQVPLNSDFENQKMLIIYDLMAIVIKKTLAKIVLKISKDYQLTNGDLITIYEISSSLFTIVRQTQYFMFSKMDIMYTFNEYELKIQKSGEGHHDDHHADIGAEEKKHLKGKYHNDLLPNGAYKYKCYQNTKQITKKQLTVKEFEVDPFLISKKRTVQNKVIEVLLIKLFSKDTIKQLIDILFKDMCSDAQIYKDAYDLHFRNVHEPYLQKSPLLTSYSGNRQRNGMTPQQNIASLNQAESDCQIEHNHDINDELVYQKQKDPPQALKFGTNMTEYIQIKNILYIEKIKDIVGLILAYCKKTMKYEVLEIIMRGVIFKKQKLRESFMQEILKASEESEFESALQYYINHNDLTTDKYFDSHHIHWERVFIVTQVDAVKKVIEVDENLTVPNIDSFIDKNIYKRLFVLTNKGFHLFKDVPDNVKCKNCPPSLFCPVGPQQEQCVRYQDIIKVISFPQMPQKLVIILNANLNSAKGDHNLKKVTIQLTLLIPTYTKCSSILTTLTNILKYNVVKKTHGHGEQSKHGHGRKAGGHGHGKSKHKHGHKKPKDPDLIQLSNEIRQTDTLVQYYLKTLLSQNDPSQMGVIAPDRANCFQLNGLRKSHVNKLQLTYVTLKRTTLLTKEFFRSHIPNKSRFDAQINDSNDNSIFSFLRSDDDSDDISDSLTISNCCVVFMICDKLFVLKEDVNRWSYQKVNEPNSLKSFNKNLKSEIKKSTMSNQSYCHAKLLKTDFNISRDEGSLSPEQAEQREYHNKNFVPMFDVLLCVPVDKIDKIMVHKGREPSVDIRCYNSSKWKICLLFSGDMERQLFLDQIFAIKKKLVEPSQHINHSSDDDDSIRYFGGKTPQDKENDDNSSQPDDSESQEEIVEQVVYD